ncbi:hypothetical protein Sjap_017600 [Stephania japonica]|uniref:Uncharacterized protein n=1 Tax=Stephania japonica TaxID=461633 RepID=A0AAP0NKK5_9MAGN
MDGNNVKSNQGEMGIWQTKGAKRRIPSLNYNALEIKSWSCFSPLLAPLV